LTKTKTLDNMLEKTNKRGHLALRIDDLWHKKWRTVWR